VRKERLCSYITNLGTVSSTSIGYYPGFQGRKEAFCSIMALSTPASILVDENQQINRGKRADGPRAKGLKPSENPGNQGRRALKDLSNFSKGTGLKDTSTLKEKSQQKPRSNVANTIKGNALKDKPILKEKSTQEQRSKALKNPMKILVDEEIKMCHEWAKDGVEGFHSTQNNSQKLDKDLLDKRVKKKVAAVNSALCGWPDTVFDSLMYPSMEVAELFYEQNVLELLFFFFVSFNSSSGMLQTSLRRSLFVKAIAVISIFIFKVPAAEEPNKFHNHQNFAVLHIAFDNEIWLIFCWLEKEPNISNTDYIAGIIFLGV
ncbi:hypothetical protein ACJX0J_025928, partial [Zea mays]